MKHLKLFLMFFLFAVIASCSGSESQTGYGKKQVAISTIRNDLILIQHIVKYAKEDAIEIFNSSQPIPKGRFKAKDTTPLRIHDGLVDVDSLIINIENQLNHLDHEKIN